MINRMLRCVLVDDEHLALQYMKVLLEQIPEIEVVKVYDNPLKFLEDLSHLKFDFCILDIEMPGMNGIQVANLLGDKKVIFTTAYTEYAVEAFEVDAVDYICKPVKKERLQKAIEKVKVISFNPNIKNEYIKVNTEKGKALLYFESLSFISVSEVDSRDKVAYLSNGNQVKLKNISFHKLLQQLPERQFCQVNKKEIIAMNIVKYYSYDLIESNYILEGKAKSFTIGNNFREQFLRYI